MAIGVLNPPVVDPLPLSRTSTVRIGASGYKAAHTGCPARGCPAMPVPTAVGVPVSDPIVAGFAVQWDAASRIAIQRYGDRLDWVIVEGAFLGRGKRDEITVTLDRYGHLFPELDEAIADAFNEGWRAARAAAGMVA